MIEDLKDQLKRWLSHGGKVTPAATPSAKMPMPRGPAASSEPVGDTSWKSGVTPLAPSGIAQSESVARHDELQPAPVVRRSPLARASGRDGPGVPSTAKPQQSTKTPVQHLRAPANTPGKPVFAREELSFAAPGVGPIARSADFRFPADWVEAGLDLQSPGGGAGKALPVRIGIDFGTAYTKVSIRAAEQVFFLHWDGVFGDDETVFLPGELCQLDGGSIFLGRAPDANSVLSHLKLPFLPGASTDADARGAAVVFLAWVMRYARAWLYREQAALVQRRRLAWEVNIGCPTTAWGSRNVVSLYRHVGLSAWRLSQSLSEITMLAARDALNNTAVGSESEIGLDGLYPIPEFVAQIASYARSPQRHDGLHLLVDCGAGTLDVVTFNVHRQPHEDFDRYPIFSSAVEPLGTHFLMGARLAAMQMEQSWDDGARVPSAEEFGQRLGVASSSIEEVDRDFLTRAKGVIKNVLLHTRQRRSPLAGAWENGLPYFLTGGGSFCKVYRDAVDQVCAELRVPGRHTPFPQFQAIRGNSLGEGDLHRMSVAFGLTYDKEVIGRIVPAEEIEDLIIPPQPARTWLDRDELYPK